MNGADDAAKVLTHGLHARQHLRDLVIRIAGDLDRGSPDNRHGLDALPSGRNVADLPVHHDDGQQHHGNDGDFWIKPIRSTLRVTAVTCTAQGWWAVVVPSIGAPAWSLIPAAMVSPIRVAHHASTEPVH